MREALKIIIFTALLYFSVPASGKVAFLGDSITTGAVTHEAIRFDPEQLAKIFSDQVSLKPLAHHEALLERAHFLPSDWESPRRLWPTPREYLGGVQWVGQHVSLVLAKQYLNVEQFAWSNLLARRLGFEAKDILLAAQDGAKILSTKDQLERVLSAMNGEALEHLFIFFTGNDLCGPTRNLVTETSDYGSATREALYYLKKNAPLGPKGLRVWLVDPIGVLQLAYSKSIQEKKVKAHGETLSCKELHELDPQTKTMNFEGDLWMQVMSLVIPPTPTAYCPMILRNKSEEDRNNLIFTGNRIKAYREELAKISEEFKTDDSLQVRHLKSPGKILLEGSDIAEDCFHLGLSGQLKVAEGVYREMMSE